MKMIRSSGGIIVRQGKMIVVKGATNNVGFPKGAIKKGESARAAAYREISEETGLEKKDLIHVRKLGTYSRKRGNKELLKKIAMFLFQTCEK